MKKIMITALLALFLSGCDNSPPAPYGFKWGQSVEDIQKLNLDGIICYEGAVCNVEEMPDHTRGQAVLMFNKESKLVEILYTNTLEIMNTSEEQALNEYEREIASLTAIYGPPIQNIKRLDDTSNLLDCLQKADCAEFTTNFSKDGYDVNLQMVDGKNDTVLIQGLYITPQK
ncbi:hypothetical protein [Providencia vermicola]|uniref:hypothetical protein n=1 Tax=Providencia vermicola TaxID=333965 RepID=UPI0034D5350F